ncbi:MAG: TlpA disulfide reductase family protein [Bacteroidales bacterium]
MRTFKSIISVAILLVGMTALSQPANEMEGLPEGVQLINLRDADNAETGFSDILAKYKGKVIYLDFWASWCGPCRGEMPHSANMKKQLAGKDVVFVYISSDQDAAKWEGMIKQLQITGEHYLTNQKAYQEYNQLLNVKTIPRYVIIDREGQIVNSNAPRPSNPQSVTDVKKLL